MNKIILLALIGLFHNVCIFAQTTYIKTVVHVLYTTPSEDISDATVLNYIDQVNQGYAKLLPAKFARTPDIFANDWANTNIQLCLATVDPSGNATIGITHTAINDPFQSSQNPSTPSEPVWNPVNYLNIYLVPVYAEPSFPNFVLGGWASPPTNPQWGATFNYVVVATNSVPFIPELLSHEIGHVFGLEHISDDNLSDTPKGIEDVNPSSGYSTTCSAGLQTQNSTNLALDGNHWGGVDPPDMVENFMGLSFSCQFMFTEEQATLMNNYINTHLSSWSSNSCSQITTVANLQSSSLNIQIYPNPSSNQIIISNLDNDGMFNIDMIDQLGRILKTEKEIPYHTNIDISHLPSGLYIIKIEDKQSKLISYLHFNKI